MSTVATLDIAGDGSITGLYTEAIPLASLGRLSVGRASNIEFNEASQEWEVLTPDTPPTVLFSNQSRQDCLTWEHNNADQLIYKNCQKK